METRPEGRVNAATVFRTMADELLLQWRRVPKDA